VIEEFHASESCPSSYFFHVHNFWSGKAFSQGGEAVRFSRPMAVGGPGLLNRLQQGRVDASNAFMPLDGQQVFPDL
jgi:hypothetical protein